MKDKIRIVNGASRVVSGAEDHIGFDEFENFLNKIIEEEAKVGYRLKNIYQINYDVTALVFNNPTDYYK